MRKKALEISMDANGVLVANRKGVREFLKFRTQAILPAASCYSRETIVGREFRSTRRGKKVLITEVLYQELLDELYQTPRLFLRWMSPLQDAPTVCESFREARHVLRVVTKFRSANPECLNEWLHHHRIRPREILLQGPQGNKTEPYQRSDVVVDDELEQLDPVAHHPRVTTLLMVSSRTVGTERFKQGKLAPIRPVRRWSEIHEIVKDLSEVRRAA